MKRLLPLPVTDLADLWELYAVPARPHVRAGFVQSLDGALAVDGSSQGLSGPADREVLRTLRAVSDVVLVGAGTARSEDYGPIPVSAGLRRRRADQGQSERPALAVLTRDAGAWAASSRLFGDPDGQVALLTAGSATGSLPDHVEVIALGGAQVEPATVITLLQQRFGPRVLCEGGPQLLAQLLDADLVDELCLTLSPQFVGGPPHLLPARLTTTRAARLTSLVEHRGELLARWALGTTGAAHSASVDPEVGHE